MHSRFPAAGVHQVVADFTCPVALPLLDGMVIANALHFQQEQEQVVRLLPLSSARKAALLIVEYNTERGNTAVPHPFAWGWG